MVSKKPTYEELEKSVKALEKEVVTLKGAEEKIGHLNQILSAIYNVSNLINRERNRYRLLKGICDKLIETRGYYNAWIALLDKSRGLVTTAESGLGKDFLPMIGYLKKRGLTNCGQKALSRPGVAITKDPLSACADCPLADKYAGRAGMTVKLEYGGKLYGLLSCSISRDFISYEEEKDLFKEIAISISYALYSLEMEEREKKAEQVLEESEKKYRKIFDQSKDAIYITTQEGRFIDINQSFLNFFSYTREELMDKDVREIYINPDDRSLFRQEIDKKGSIQDFEVKLRKKDGTELTCLISAVVIREDAGSIRGYQGIIRDITERKQAEEALKKSHDELDQALSELKSTQMQMLQSEKMASVGQLAAGVAHEINNPTGFVSSNLKTLSNYQNDITKLIKQYRKLITDLKDITNKENLPSSITEQMEQIVAYETEVDLNFILDDILDLIKESKEGTERIKKIVLDLKDFAHPGEDKIQTTDINKGIESTVNVAWNELKYKATVTKEYGDLPQVQCYPQQLNQVFMNILVNAAHAIEKHGEIGIVTRALDGQVEIEISDTGVGIPKQNLPKIFDPFFTTKKVGKGTGLGLNMAYNIIKKHKGTIDVESEVGKGTIFTIRIPVG